MRVLLIDNYDSFTYNLVQALGALGAQAEVVRNDATTVEAALSDPPAAIVISPGPRTPAQAGISVDLVRAAAARQLPLLGVCLGHQAIGAAFGGRIVQADRLLHGKTSLVQHDGAGVFADLPQGFVAMRYHSLVVEEPLPPDLVRTAWTDPSASRGPARNPANDGEPTDLVSIADAQPRPADSSAALARLVVTTAATSPGKHDSRADWTRPSKPGVSGRASGPAPELMGLRHRTLPIHGVQFHPESFLTDQGPQILANFLALAASPISS